METLEVAGGGIWSVEWSREILIQSLTPARGEELKLSRYNSLGQMIKGQVDHKVSMKFAEIIFFRK